MINPLLHALAMPEHRRRHGSVAFGFKVADYRDPMLSGVPRSMDKDESGHE